MRRFGKQFLRFTFIIVFTYFAVSQFMNPEMWTGFVPKFLASTTDTARTWVHINAVLESLAVVFLAFDRLVKWVTFLLALHLIGIATTIGFTPIGVRDFGLALSVLALSFLEWNENEAR
jgi:hypothetical protein